MHDPLAAHEHPPRVRAVDGEVVLIDRGVCASYTPDAAQEAAKQILMAAERARQQSRHDAYFIL